MKRLFILTISAFLLISFTPTLRAQKQITWYSFEEAYQLNKKKPKKIFIDVYTEWCGWCKKMDAITFTDPVIVEYMMKNFYCVKFDAERKDTVSIDGVVFVNPNPAARRSTHNLAVELLRGKLSYPSYVFLNEKSQFMTVVPGYQPPRDFEPILHFFGEDAFKEKSFDEFKATFKGKIQ